MRQHGLVTFALLLGGCLHSEATLCDDGRLCPAGTSCSPTAGCVVPEQVASCLGEADGAACSYPGQQDGVCRQELCVPAGCGNAVVEGDEVCDDGDNDSGDGCSADCLSDETCGNGQVDELAGEACDDGNNVGGDDCQADCATPHCGDGITDVQFNELCDDGDENSDDTPDASCRRNCQPARCGDQTTDPGLGEVCDDGNLDSGDGCSPDCRSTEVCGNGYVDGLVGELCDDGNNRQGDGCEDLLCLLERPSWAAPPAAPTLDYFYSPGMAFDTRRGRAVLFGGGDDPYYDETWEWDGVGWTRIDVPGTRPSGRTDAAMVYDADRGRIVLFGGYDGTYLGDTWEWDGARWYDVTPSGESPSGRTEHAMAYNAELGKVVLFGGSAGNPDYESDTWLWDGSSWGEWVDPAPETPGPPKRWMHAMAYDGTSRSVVMFGGRAGGGDPDDSSVWTFDGLDWTETPKPVTGDWPTERFNHSMASDPLRQQVVMFGGSTDLPETWVWDETGWHDVTPVSSALSLRREAPMAFDTVSGNVMLFGGSSDGVAMNDTWQWNGADWTKVSHDPLPALPFTFENGLAYDRLRGRAVFFDGASTWEWDAYHWSDVTPEGMNPAEVGEMVYDEANREVVLVTGSELWTWDGAVWANRTPESGPVPWPRTGHAIAYDSSRGRVVLFGGRDYLSDVWEWDGANWHEMTPATTLAPSRRGHAMAFDARRGRVVAFKGLYRVTTKYDFRDDVWEWDGVDWYPSAATGLEPTKRYASALFYDYSRQRLILFGGYGTDSNPRYDTWEYDGTSWSDITPESLSPDQEACRGAYFATRRRSVLVGLPAAGGAEVTWVHGYDRADTASEICLDSIDNDLDGLADCADPDCWGYCAPLCAPELPCDPAAPHCGDGQCNPALETCRSCPGDCGACVECGDFLCAPEETHESCPNDCD